VLNPDEARAARPEEGRSDGGEITFHTATEKYEIMRRSVPLPSDLTPHIAYEHLEFYQLRALPADWLFDEEGNWIGWRTEEPKRQQSELRPPRELPRRPEFSGG